MKETIISFTHTNYCIRSAGTEKFVRNISELLQSKEYSHLNFFSFYDNKKMMRTKLVGVNFNDSFQGIFEYVNIPKIINQIGIKEGLKFVAIHLQHILHHDLVLLEKLIVKLNIPTYFIAHDYYLLCPSLKMINSNNVFCGISSPNAFKCTSCRFGDRAVAHGKQMNGFFAGISHQLVYIIAPSNYVMKSLKRALPDYQEKIVTRPHLVLEGKRKLEKIQNRPLNIAFAGGQLPEKGYNQWEELVDRLSENENYRFYYLGNGRGSSPKIKSIFVSTAVQGEDAMVKAMEENNIDLVFLWPNWPETYSYVYYELSVAGAFILTNPGSGNIADAVAENKNGMVFDCFDSCVNWLNDNISVIQEINNYRCEGYFRPNRYSTNDDLNMLIGKNGQKYIPAMKELVHARVIETTLYLLKYRNIIWNKVGK